MTTPILAYFDWTDPIAQEILASSEIEAQQLELSGDVCTNWKVLEASHGYQALIRTEAARRPGVGESWLPGAELIARCPDLLAITTIGAGFDVVDVDGATEAGVIVCNNAGPGREAVAEHALGLMLVLCKKIALADRMLRRALLESRACLKGTELLGKTLGIVGLGNIGARLAEMCHLAFGMEVLAFDPHLASAEIEARGAIGVTFDELLAHSDFVLANCPLNEETRGMFDQRAFAAMKPTAFFVTTARGEVHDEADLFTALATGEIAGAGLDVFHMEPPPPNHPLLSLDNVVATPHVAGITVEATRSLAEASAQQWITIFDGHVPPRLLNPDAWPRYCDRFAERFGRRPEPLANS